jgi:DNA-directed RNA polymerase alpha subunit
LCTQGHIPGKVKTGKTLEHDAEREKAHRPTLDLNDHKAIRIWLLVIIYRNEEMSVKRLTRLDPIEKMDLPTRAYNVLQRADINTVGKLLDFPREALWDLKNIGAKSVTEICEAIENTTINPFEVNDSIPDDLPTVTFIGIDGNMYNDIPIEDLGLTKRPYNCLKGAGVNYFSQLQNMNKDELLAFPNMGS